MIRLVCFINCFGCYSAFHTASLVIIIPDIFDHKRRRAFIIPFRFHRQLFYKPLKSVHYYSVFQQPGLRLFQRLEILHFPWTHFFDKLLTYHCFARAFKPRFYLII